MFAFLRKEKRVELPFAEVARRLQETFGWLSYDASPALGTISYVSRRGRRFRLDLDGGAHEFMRGEPLVRTDPDESMSICDVLGLKDLKWGRDAAGNVVAFC